jgi:cation:H+ antiporter
MEYFYSVLGFIILLGSGNYLVRSSVSLARYFHVSTLVIGLTVVAFGTSAPELIVSLQASLKAHPEISLGNVIGSNISNIALVLALAVIISPIAIKKSTVITDWSVMMISGVLFYIFILNGWLNRVEGIIFCCFIILYIIYSLRYSRLQQIKSKQIPEKPEFTLGISLLITIGSCAGLIIGGDLLIDNSIIIAKRIGVSERAISISMIAIGTSLPELTTSVIAAIKKESDISIGNIIGSNIFNILSVLGITAIIAPIKVSSLIRNFDTLWMLGISVLLFTFMLPAGNSKLSRINGIILFSLYLIYLYLVLK